MAEVATIRKYKSGEIVFKEGDPSGAAFVIVRGGVELTKNSRLGSVQLASLKSGELFGEMGVIEGSPRTSTAKAVGPTTLKEIPPGALLNGIQNDPDISSKVMTKLLERLQTADAAMGAPAASRGAPNATPPKKKGFFSRFFSTSKERESVFEILFADFLDDENRSVTTHYFEQLSRMAEQIGGGLINIRRAGAPFVITDFSDTPMTWGQVQTNARSWLGDMQADLLIWGRVNPKGATTHMRYVQAQGLRAIRAGYIQPCDAIDLPSELDEVMAGYFYASAVGAMIPGTRAQAEAFDPLLGPALESAKPAMKNKWRELNNDQRARIDLGFANLLSTCAIMQKRPERLKEADEVYMRCSRGLKRSKEPLLSGIIQRHMGFAMAAWQERGGNNNLIEAAVESMQNACDYFTREEYPMEWAELQSEMGQLLYKKDQIGEDSQALPKAIACYQSALQVFSATATPRRWGDAKHHLARALQLMGSQTGDLDMIARSAEACREALAVRNKNQTPMLWAATQNNLGSALFMLCQKTRKPETAEAAVKAFEAALEVYQARRASKLVKVTEKNLNRAREVAIDVGPIMSPDQVAYGTGSEPADEGSSGEDPKT